MVTPYFDFVFYSLSDCPFSPKHQLRRATRASRYLLLLGTTAAGTLGSLNGLLVASSGAALETLHEAGGSLERTLEVAGGGLAKDVDLDEVALEGALEGDDGLDQEGVGVLHVDVHEGHHGNSHGLGTEGLAELGGVVGVDGGGDKLALLGGSHRWWLDVLERGKVYCLSATASITLYNARNERTLLLVNLGLDVEVDDGDDDVAGNVAGAAHVQDVGVFEGDLAGDLHHAEHDDQVGAAALSVRYSTSLLKARKKTLKSEICNAVRCDRGKRRGGNVHLGADHFGGLRRN